MAGPNPATCSVLPFRIGGLWTSLRSNASSSRDRGTAPEDEKQQPNSTFTGHKIMTLLMRTYLLKANRCAGVRIQSALRSPCRAFTLIELLVVIAIIAILAAL